jgi:hypothetical protein
MITIVSLLLLTAPTAFAQLDWTEHTIDGSFNGATSVFVEDVDGDGDMDVLGAAFYANDITWWENDGNESFTEHTIDGNFDGAWDVYAVDLDDDSDVDVLGAAYDAYEIAWWRNDGDENFDKLTITTSCHNTTSVYAASLDGNNTLDILAASMVGDSISYWVQLLPGQFLPIPFTITTDFNGVREVYAADVDGDSDVDVLGAAEYDHEITWWENMGSNLFTEHTIDGDFEGASSVYAEDVDGDEDMDVLGAAIVADDITWWENDGDENFTEHTIDGNFAGAYSVYAEDVDGDGDIDVLGAAWFGADIAWWENDGDENFTEHTIDGSFNGAISVYAEDVDGDGDMDVLGAAQSADDITWWEQVRPPSVSTNSIDFGQVPVGLPSSLPLTIYGNNDLQVILSAVYADDPAFTTDFDPADSLLVPGDSLQITVTFLPGEMIPFNGTLFIENSEKVVTVSLAGEGIEAVDVTLTPYNPPIIIPESGGSFDFNIALENRMPGIQTIDIWTEVELPEVGSIDIYTVNDLSIPAGITIDRDRTQNVPEFAPSGIYTYYAYVGDRYQWLIDDYDSFTFEKEGSADGTLGSQSDWLCCGEGFEEWQTIPEVAIPTESALLGVYPNPFNATTVISYQLAEVSQVSLEIFDVSGRLIESPLHDVWREAGMHEVVFDRSDLHSGVYVYRLTAGDFVGTGKMVLLK